MEEKMNTLKLALIAMAAMTVNVHCLSGEDPSSATQPRKIQAALGMENLFYYPSDINERIPAYISAWAGGPVLYNSSPDIVLSFGPSIQIDYHAFPLLDINSEIEFFWAPKLILASFGSYYIAHYGLSASGGLSSSIRLFRSLRLCYGCGIGYYWSFFKEFSGSSIGGTSDVGAAIGKSKFLIRGRYAKIPASEANIDLPLTGIGFVFKETL
jgi:hypothetical protein